MKRLICIAALLLPGAARSDGAELYRLYDFTPVSGTNPVVARVADCGIEIPASEFRRYVETMPPPNGDESKRPKLLTTEMKRADLEKLIDEHFLMWEGYQQKADQTPFIAHLLDVTKGMLMRETLVSEEVKAKAKTPKDYDGLYKELCDRLFNQTDITVSNEAYEEVKTLLKQPPAALAPAVRDSVFAKCKAGDVTIGELLGFYMKMPANQRPDLQTHDGVDAILEQMLEEALLTDEARARGLENAPIVVEKLQLNRNKLCRMFALNQFGPESVEQSREPGAEARVAQWYKDHLKDRYTYKDANGKEQVTPYQDAHARIENDYVDDLREQLRAEHLRELRKGHAVEIDEKAMEQAIPGSGEIKAP